VIVPLVGSTKGLRLLGIALAAIGLAYPVLVYLGLSLLNPIHIVVLLLVFVLVRIVASMQGDAVLDRAMRAAMVFAAGLVLLVFFLDEELALKVYPLAINAGLAVIFGYSLLRPPSIVERIAAMTEGDLSPQARSYMRAVTKVWLIFFFANGAISAWTAVFESREVWTLYNGFIAYLLIGALFVGEMLVRRKAQRYGL
jgi:uncharacterized membrane protein